MLGIGADPTRPHPVPVAECARDPRACRRGDWPGVRRDAGASHRPADEQSFVRQVDEVQRPEGYRLVGAFEEDGARASAVAGFRICHGLAWGHYLYHLDSGVGIDRADAHRLYLNAGLVIAAHHFARYIE